MKKFLVIALTILSTLSIIHFAQANSQDQVLIDRFTNKIDTIYQTKGDDFITRLEDRIEQILETPKSERLTYILNALLDYMYEKYTVNNYNENFYSNKNTETEEKTEVKKPIHKQDIGIKKGETNANTAEFKTIGYYNVVGDKIIFDTGVDSKIYRAIWDKFQKIIPADMRKTVTEFDGYEDPDAWTAASVSKADSTNGVKWGLNVNTSMITKNGKVTADGLELLIHEFGHVLTLAGDQMNHLDEENKPLVKKTKDECKTFFVDSMSACIYKESYLNKFINNFWSDKEYLHRALTEPTFNAREGHQTDFVSGYAASNPVEDIAESFAHFVLEDKPTGKTIAEKKMLFFYNYPDFVRLRNNVLANK